MSENNNPTPISGYLTAAVIGAVVGAGIALLYAPCSGEETRKALNRRAKDIKGRAASALEDAKEYISSKKEDITGSLRNGQKRHSLRARQA